MIHRLLQSERPPSSDQSLILVLIQAHTSLIRFFFLKIHLSAQSRSLSNVKMLLHWAPHALTALAQTAVWKSVSNKFGAGLACDHEPRRSHDCHSAPGLPQQPRQICTGFTALTTSAARTNYRTVSGTCRNKALTQKGCLVSAGLYYLFIFLSPS